jgi:hypothetical protein
VRLRKLALRERSKGASASADLRPRLQRLPSDSLLMLDRSSLYQPSATLQVQGCALSVAGSHTLPVSMVINDPYLLAIHH